MLEMTVRNERTRRSIRHALFRPPAIAGPRERSFALAAMFAAGSVLAAVTLVLPFPGELELTVAAAIWLVGLPIGYVLVVLGKRLPPWAFHPILAGGSIMIAALAWSTGPGTTPVAYATLLIWVALYAGYFHSFAGAAVHGVIAVSCYAAVLVRLEQPMGMELFTLAWVAAVVAGVANWLSHARALAEIDPLTGIANRRGLARHLEVAMAQAASERSPLSVALLDIDDFRRLNQQQGPGAADQLLKDCADRFRAALPRGAQLARYGGDEFVVVLPDHGLSRAREVVDALRREGPAGHSYSAGVAAFVPGDTQSMLVSRADSALYTAKHGGRGFTAVVGEDPDAASELWAALDAGEISLHYQPIHDLRDGRLVEVEALVRWEHPTRGPLDPASFVPAAEHSGAIHALGRWVATETCRQLQRWRTELPGCEGLGAAINLSTAQLSHPDLVTDLRNALSNAGLPASALTVELTEGAFEGEHDRIVQLLSDLKALGVRLAMDDFGTGHSSLARLRSLPFDVLKIDRSFVTTAGEDPGGSMLPAIVGVARSLGLETTAEGVEDAWQLEYVTEHGCTRAQGYLLGRPETAGAFEARLRQPSGSADEVALWDGTAPADDLGTADEDRARPARSSPAWGTP